MGSAACCFGPSASVKPVQVQVATSWWVQVKQVSENPLAKQPPTRRRAGEEDGMETRILELSINKICRWAKRLPRSGSCHSLQYDAQAGLVLTRLAVCIC